MKIVKEFILREIAGENVLIPTGKTAQDFNGLITLSETAKFIWENIEKAESLDAMISMIYDNFEADMETIQKDAIEFISELLGRGFIQCTKEDRTW